MYFALVSSYSNKHFRHRQTVRCLKRKVNGINIKNWEQVGQGWSLNESLKEDTIWLYHTLEGSLVWVYELWDKGQVGYNYIWFNTTINMPKVSQFFFLPFSFCFFKKNFEVSPSLLFQLCTICFINVLIRHHFSIFLEKLRWECIQPHAFKEKDIHNKN